MQQANIEKQIQNLQTQKKYEEFGEEESEEELEFDDEEQENEEENFGNIQESTVVAHKTEKEIKSGKFPTNKQVNNRLKDTTFNRTDDKSRMTFGQQDEEDKSLLKATMFRNPEDPSRWGDDVKVKVGAKKGKNVFKKSAAFGNGEEDEEDEEIEESRVLQRKITEQDDDDENWKI